MKWNGLELPDKPYYSDDAVVIYNADCMEILPSIRGVSAVVTDPPYELGFMGKSWDRKGISFQIDTWQLIREACLPGAMLLSFGGTRTSHRIACAIEDGGWQIRDTICWVYSTGFPKSLNISKQLQKKSLCGIIEVDEEINHNTTGIESKTSGAKGEKQTPKYCLRLMPKADLQKGVYTKEERGEVLQPSLSQQGISQSRQSTDYDGEGQSSVEGWCNIQASQRELQRCQICQMSERIPDNGEERWLCYGTPLGYGTAYWSPTPQDRSCPSYRPQPSEQPNRQSNTIPHKQSSQELRGAIELWEGYGTGLKPAYESITLAMKPLEEPAFDIVQAVMLQLRHNGLEGEVRWKQEPAISARKQRLSQSSTLTSQRKTAEVSAELASEKGMQSTENDTQSEYESKPVNGGLPTKNALLKLEKNQPENCGNKLSMPMGENVLAAGKQQSNSLPLTILTKTGNNTAKKSGVPMSTETSAKGGSPQYTDCYAGIATAPSQDMANVRTSYNVQIDGKEWRIDQLEDGSLVWPGGLPRYRPAKSLTFANNALKHGVAGLNIDATRILTEEGLKGGQYSGKKRENANCYGKHKNLNPEQYQQPKGRFPANFILGYPEDEYELREGITTAERENVVRWLYENA